MSGSSAGSEMLKSLLFVGAAVGTLLVAFMTKPSKIVVSMDDEVDKPLFAEFNTNAANGLEVLSFDEELGQMKQFKVAQQEQGLWVIPSHESYPADAQARLVNAATMFVDLNVVAVVSDQDSDHATFGVVEPSIQETRVGDEGVGTLVTVSGNTQDGQAKLASLIIGKPVKGLEGQHYVRLPGKSRVYQVRIDPSQLSTRFQDWIETDLLQLNPQDLASVTIKDYSTLTQRSENTFDVIPDHRMELKADVTGDTWTLDWIKELTPDGEVRSTSIEEGEELKPDRLDTLRAALGDLRIVDVQRKPRGLEAALQSGSELPNESIGSLANRGFYAIQNQDGSVELKCSDGELVVDTQDGVRYLLRFGQIAGLGEQPAQSVEPGEAVANSLNRYMFVSVSVNEDQFPEPEMPVLPDGAEALPDDQTDGAESLSDNELALEVERIKKAYQRQLDQRNDQIEAAKTKVSALNYRFADWYYIVSDDVFKKLRLHRNDLIGYSDEFLRSGSGIQAFNYLKQLGLKSAADGGEQP